MRIIKGTGRRLGAVVMAAVVVTSVASCTSDDKASSTTGPASGLGVEVDTSSETAAAAFEVRPGTREATVTGAKKGDRLSLVDADGKRLVILKADKLGQAHFAYVGTKLLEVQTGDGAKLPTSEGRVVEAGDGYTIRNEDADPVQVSKPFAIRGRDDAPDPSYFDGLDKLVPEGDDTSLFGYVTMRDGVQLSVNIRLPGPADQGPYPTVIEYSGYGPSNPDAQEPGSLIASVLGFATVGVNMRGTGCSGGVFDVFNASQQSDGYDVVESIARQPWVKNNKVGLIGLSYSGIGALYTATTAPPSLAAVAPMSVIKDPWLQQWPGGVYNGGFTREWLSERDKQSAAGGTSWVQKRLDGGDETCQAHQALREQNMDFQAFGKSLVHRPPLADERDLSKLVDTVNVPVFLTGAWQDEQTGPQFADMLGNFDKAPVKRFTLMNGRHPDGYTPYVLSRWYEFLELYVDHEVPHMSDAMFSSASVVAGEFGFETGEFEAQRFLDLGPDEYDAALARFEADPEVRVLFDMGAKAGTPAGTPEPVFVQTYDTWPPADIDELKLYADGDGALATSAPSGSGADRFLNDTGAGATRLFAEDGYPMLESVWKTQWTPFADSDAVSYTTAPFTETKLIGGPGRADLRIRVPGDEHDADVQVAVTLIDTAGTEWVVTNGLLRLSDRKVDPSLSKGDLYVDRTFAPADAEDLPTDAYTTATVSLPSFAQAVRAGERLRVTVSSPGRNFAAWAFETIGTDDAPRDLAWGGADGTSVTLGVLPSSGEVPAIEAACPSRRGQACRPDRERTNTKTPS